jgi:hypothetical protein
VIARPVPRRVVERRSHEPCGCEQAGRDGDGAARDRPCTERPPAQDRDIKGPGEERLHRERHRQVRPAHCRVDREIERRHAHEDMRDRNLRASIGVEQPPPL